MPSQIWFDVMPDAGGWAVRCEQAHYGRYRTQSEALNVAVAEARKVKDTKRAVQVRVLREAPKEEGYLGLL